MTADEFELADFAMGIARKAGKMIMAQFPLGVWRRSPIEHKAGRELVSEIDRASERMLVGAIRQRYPEHGIVAEEGGVAAGTNGEPGYRWIIDPLDGTTNFAHGFPVYSISIALERCGEIGMGVVFDPTRGEMFTALRGGGAELNGRRISVSSTPDLDHSLLSTGFPYDVRESRENNLDHFADFAVRAQAVRRCGSAALDLCYVACGRFDGFWELKLAPWDVAAGMLMVTEAGGRVTDFSGGRPDTTGKETVASNGRIHESMIQVLGPRLAASHHD